jgi:hypothetical protein
MTGIEYQPDVYRRAARLARRRGASTIVDVGCGNARKLVALHPEFEVIGLDIGSNIERCRAAYPFGAWIEHDLESGTPLPVDDNVLRTSVIVCADVIEHLLAPERALRTLSGTPALCLLVSTPDRWRVYGGEHLGPPANPAHVREWSRKELGLLLKSCGLAQGYMTYTRPHTWTIALETLLYVECVDSSEP